MTPFDLLKRSTGVLLVAIMGLVILNEWHVADVSVPAAALMALLLVILLPRQTRGRQAFILIAGALTVALALQQADWADYAVRGLGASAFITAFYTALATLRSVAAGSPSIREAGTYLSRQPPGRRYLALTFGGQIFSLFLNFGAIALLGNLAASSAAAEPDEVIRTIRTRRMLLAIQRGFLASLVWSPLALAMALTTTLVPGASWATALPAALVSSLIIAGTGWALDTILKPRPRPGARPMAPPGSWRVLVPLLWLLTLLAVAVLGLHAVAETRIIGIVTLIVPLVALGWLAIQSRDPEAERPGRRLSALVLTELPGYRSELVFIALAGYVGTVGAPLLAPVIRDAGLDPAAWPGWAVLIGALWLMPVLGLVGLNPILAITLLAPLIPEPAALGLPPTALVTAIVAGWAMSAAWSPFTASTLLLAGYGGVSAAEVGFRWNGLYVLLTGLALSLWSLAVAALAG